RLGEYFSVASLSPNAPSTPNLEERSVKAKRRPPRKKPAAGPSLLERLNPNAAGIDCGSDTHYVAVPADRDPTPVRAFQTCTADLHRLADWLTARGVATGAREVRGGLRHPSF